MTFKGEYLYGERNGKGSEYFRNGKLQFEGEYINGKKWNGKGYDEKGNIEFEIKDGKGTVIEYKFDDLIFIGEYINGERNGNGEEYKYGRLTFEGEYLNGQKKEKEKNIIKMEN